jgi:glycosyltransferase involved in cell wall biosynthesis
MDASAKMPNSASPSRSLTIAILALNEASLIYHCLQSASFADQLLVIDSGSTDSTPEIAHSFGADVYCYPDWQGFAIQRTRALKHCRCDYLFFLDCDETIPSELAEEIRNVIAQGTATRGLIRWDDHVCGKRIRGAHQTKGVARLFKANNVIRFEGQVHESAIFQSPPKSILLQTRLIHHSRRSIHQSLLKLAQYSQLGAIKLRHSGRRVGIVAGMAHALPRFLNLYFFKGSFRSGSEGFLYSLFVALEVFFKYCAARYDVGPEADVPARR